MHTLTQILLPAGIVMTFFWFLWVIRYPGQCWDAYWGRHGKLECAAQWAFTFGMSATVAYLVNKWLI